MIYSEFNIPLLLEETETLVFSDGARLLWRMGDGVLLVYLLGEEHHCEVLASGNEWTIRAGNGDYALQAGDNVLLVERKKPSRLPHRPRPSGPRTRTAA